MSNLHRLPKLYKNPSSFFDREAHESVSIVFHEAKAGKEAFRIHGDFSRDIAQFIIAEQQKSLTPPNPRGSDMKRSEIIIYSCLAAYLLIAVVTFGHSAAHSTLVPMKEESIAAVNVRIGAGSMLTAAAWPLYWSWYIFEENPMTPKPPRQ